MTSRFIARKFYVFLLEGQIRNYHREGSGFSKLYGKEKLNAQNILKRKFERNIKLREAEF